MAVKKKVAPRKRKSSVPLDRRLLERVTSRAIRNAADEAFEVVDSLLVARDGWLVRVNKEGTVLKRVKKLPVLKQV